jgi:hypothetical protein
MREELYAYLQDDIMHPSQINMDSDFLFDVLSDYVDNIALNRSSVSDIARTIRDYSHSEDNMKKLRRLRAYKEDTENEYGDIEGTLRILKNVYVENEGHTLDELESDERYQTFLRQKRSAEGHKGEIDNIVATIEDNFKQTSSGGRKSKSKTRKNRKGRKSRKSRKSKNNIKNKKTSTKRIPKSRKSRNMKRKMYGGGIEDDIGKLYSLKAQITYFKNSIKEDEKRRRTNHTLNTLRKDDIESLTTEFYKLFNKIKSKISKDHLSKLELN